ncbi:hypothetical protein BBN63_21250 [Streptomyces niveus]|uniref:Uncharacterized protein n=1 Tax=Streptomyces niveus TaxID=193462 RepID=A0A1U9QXH9_STRNV|nr:hypothetical protein BBN63_21250 [Streptomyces niveus]
MRLIAEAGPHRHVKRAHATEKERPGAVAPPAGQTLVRTHAELPAERPDEVRQVGMRGLRGLPQADALDVPGIDEVTDV